MGSIPEHELPAPDSIVARNDGSHVALMFYFAAAEQDLGEIAAEQGFMCRMVSMEADLGCDDPLMREYEDGSEDAIAKWHPTPPEGWSFGDKFDTEDGPVAVFVCKK